MVIKEMRFLRIRYIVKKLNEILAGYYHYYGITDNSASLNFFYNVVRNRLFYWLNRRSQCWSCTKEGYKELLALQESGYGKAARPGCIY